MADDPRRAFGLTVSGSRDRRKMSQRELAKVARLNRSYLSRIETGHADPPLTVQSRLASALGIDLARLFELVRQEQRLLRREAAEAMAPPEEGEPADQSP
jgi:transcriptional regulator with XRE-family HTH domain